MKQFKISALMFMFFGILSANTYYRFDHQIKALSVVQGLIDGIMTSWMGNTMASLILLVLAIIVPLSMMRKSYKGTAEFHLNVTDAALRGQVYTPTQNELNSIQKPIFGKRQ